MQSVRLLVPSRHWHRLLCPIWDAPPFLIWSHYAASLCLLILASFPGLLRFHFPFAFTGAEDRRKTGKALEQSRNAHRKFIALLCYPPTRVHLVFNWHHSHDNAPRPSLFFTGLPLLCVIVNIVNQGRTGNEAIVAHAQAVLAFTSWNHVWRGRENIHHSTDYCGARSGLAQFIQPPNLKSCRSSSLRAPLPSSPHSWVITLSM